MNTNLLFTFIILNIINVIIQTIKSIATVKCKKTIAAIVNAVAYGLYTVVVVYTVCDLPLICKVAVVALCNLIGVFFVKWLEENGLLLAKNDVNHSYPHCWRCKHPAFFIISKNSSLVKYFLSRGKPNICLSR